MASHCSSPRCSSTHFCAARRKATGKYAKTAPPAGRVRWRKRWRKWFLF
nr:MAG TPA_asm: hypothetical protein [Caudoviricetes sp.]